MSMNLSRIILQRYNQTDLVNRLSASNDENKSTSRLLADYYFKRIQEDTELSPHRKIAYMNSVYNFFSMDEE